MTEHSAQVAGLEVHYRQAGDAPILYLHGVPTHSYDWVPFLERTGGIAPDLPGFGKSAKPGDFDYSIKGYDRFLEAFVDQLGLERFSLVVHDWGSVGLALAQRLPERVERLVVFSVVPFLPGFRWHRVARGWRTPGVGELLMGATTRWGLRRELPAELADHAWDAFDHGTQRAILKLYRSAPPRRARPGGRATRRDTRSGTRPVARRRSLSRGRIRPGTRRRARWRDHPRDGPRRPLDVAQEPRADRSHGRLPKTFLTY